MYNSQNRNFILLFLWMIVSFLNTLFFHENWIFQLQCKYSNSSLKFFSWLNRIIHIFWLKISIISTIFFFNVFCKMNSSNNESISFWILKNNLFTTQKIRFSMFRKKQWINIRRISTKNSFYYRNFVNCIKFSQCKNVRLNNLLIKYVIENNRKITRKKSIHECWKLNWMYQ